MPPSMQITSTTVTAYEDLDAGTKRASLSFDTDGSTPYLTVSYGNSATAVRMTNVALPLVNSDVVNKQYVDSTASGLTVKTPVRVVAMTNGVLATAYANEQVVDGVTLATGDRILLMGQTTASENGIYVVAASGAPTRAADMAVGYAACGTYCFVDQGSTYADRSFVCVTNKGSDIVGTNGLEFVQFGSRPSAMAGNGLIVGTASELDVNVDNSTLTILGDVVQVKDLGITNAKIAANTIANAKLVYSNVTVNTSRGLQGGQAVALGASMTVAPDFTVVPDLAASNTFAAANTFQGAVGVTNTTASTSTSTGALTVGGGAGIAGALYAANARLTDTTAATSTSTGALVVSGGAGIAGAVYAASGTLTDATASTSTSTGALVVAGGVGVGGRMTALNGAITDTTDATSTSTGSLTVAGGLGVAKAVYAANAHLTDATASTSTSTGALVVAGGAGVGGQLTALNGSITDTTDATSTSTGSLTVAGGLGVAKAVYAANARLTDSTAATSQTSGALVVTGGVGIGGDLYCTSSFNMSDRDLKDQLVPLADALTVIDKINGYSFVWRDMPANVDAGRAGRRTVGVIAQEVRDAGASLCVSTPDDGFMAVDYCKLVPYMVEAIKSLKRQCDSLETEVAKRRRVEPETEQ